MTPDEREAQRARQIAGAGFEGIVARILNRFLNEHNIFIVGASSDKLKAFIQNPEKVQEIIDYTKLPVKRRCDQKQLEDYPDSDLYALYKTDNDWRILSIINCKVSLHARHTETCFWGLAVRMSSYIKYVFVTEDRDSYRPVNPRSELGASCERSTATRRLLETFTDGVYVVKQYHGVSDKSLRSDLTSMEKLIAKNPDIDNRPAEWPVIFDNPNFPTHTQYCTTVRPIDDLIFDLKRWALEHSRRS